MLLENSFRPGLFALLGLLALGLGVAGAAPATAQKCGSLDGYFISFDTFGNAIPPLPEDRCSDTFHCAAPEAPGGFVRKVDPSCVAEGDATCELELRFPLEFRGNQDNIFRAGLSAPTPVVYWFDGAAKTDCEPWIEKECEQVSICGLSTHQITKDHTETWLRLGVASCNTPVPDLHSGLFSILAASCPVGSSCPKRLFDKLETTEAKVKKALGCVDPPKQDCASCRDCALPGVPADGQPPRVGGKELSAGGGAYLYYAGGGAGFPGLPGSTAWSVTLGRGWSHDYAERIVPFPDETRVFLITRSGVFREWKSPDAAGVYQEVSPSSEYRTLTWLGAGLGWRLTGLDGTVSLFDGSGVWRSTTDRNGNVTEGFHTDNRLDLVVFPDGRREDFAYYPPGDPAEGKLQTIVEVGVGGTTRTWTYVWTGDDLTRVERPDDTALVFTYGDPGLPGYLTRIELEGTDDASMRVLRGYEYSPEGRVTRTWRGDGSPTGPDAVEVWSLALDHPEEPTVATVTDPLDREITYQLGRDRDSSNVKILAISGDCPVCGLAPNTQLFYEDGPTDPHPMLPVRIVDGRRTQTLLSYTNVGRVASRTDASGELEERTTEWTYDATYPALLTSVRQSSVAGGLSVRATDWTRDADGNATSRGISGVEAGSAFAYKTLTTFNDAGRPRTIDPDGHEPDPMDPSAPTDVTTFTYDPARGNLIADTRTDPLVETTTFGYDGFNRRTSVIDPHGVETKTSYDGLDRVTEIRQVGANPPTDDLVTVHEYTVFRDLFRTRLPRGNVIEYGYDAAGRLISVARLHPDATPGERVFYTLNAAGNRTLEELQRWDVAASAWVTVSSTGYRYTNRCQVDAVIQAPGSSEEAVTSFEYDCNGNLSDQWDPNHDPDTDPPTTSWEYDALDRLTKVSQPWSPPGGPVGRAVTAYGYDVQDHLTSVTDASGNVTRYEYSDRDLLTSERSSFLVPPGGACDPAPICDPTPGCGCTTHGYDEHGELITTTDARGVTVTRTVDPLDRVTFVNYPDDALDTTYTYDIEPALCGGTSFEIGRLGSITRGDGSVEYCYDRFGRTTRDGELTYTYDANGNRTGIGYPGNVAATYTHDFADREETLTVTSPGGTESVVSMASYHPSGPLAALALGSGTTETRAFDGRYVPTAIGIASPPGAVTGRSWTYTTDRVGNVLEIVERDVCPDAPLLLQNQTITTAVPPVTHCSSIEAGPAYIVGAGGDVTFNAGERVVLKDGFSVLDGGRLVAVSGAVNEVSRRTYTYQAPQYFLTGAEGSWGTLGWTYDRIGNRLSETRDGGSPDTYQYLANGSGGNTPLLDVVNLSVGGTRDYTYGLAGHLEDVAAGANVMGFGADAEGRLSGVDRTAASETVAFSYDGRSFLRSAQETAGGTASVRPLYDSFGLVHALRRQASPTDPEELTVHLYLAGRPVAQLEIDGGGTETWRYITTDHVGTPLLATDDIGAVTWEGGFEPFGNDYQAGTPEGASENGLYLRLPGQWEDTSWQDATSGAGIYYNVWRFLEPQTGRYTRPDPLAPGGTGVSLFFTEPRSSRWEGEIFGGQGRVLRWAPSSARHMGGGLSGDSLMNPYVFAAANPLMFVDLVGLICGSGSNDPYVPDKIIDTFDGTDPCTTHDNCYCSCGKSKKFCDEQFLNDMLDWCRLKKITGQHEGSQNSICRGLARVYYTAVRLLGGPAYNNAQKGSGCQSSAPPPPSPQLAPLPP